MTKIPEGIDYIKNHDLLEEIYLERIRQTKLWGVQKHHQLLWNTILGEEVGEVATALGETVFAETPEIRDKHLENLRVELIHVAAVAIGMLESLDKNGYEGKQEVG